MSRYRVRIEGRNFLLRFSSGKQRSLKHGFFVTRDVEADSSEDAELKAVEMIKKEEAITSITINPRDDSPMLYLDSIHLLHEDEESINNSGYTYYTEDNESDDS